MAAPFRLLAVVFALSLAGIVSSSISAADRPNIVLIIADDKC